MADFTWAWFWASYLGRFIITFAEILVVVVPVLICVAYLTYWERKIIAAMQMRRGPNVVGPFGIFQPFADAIKLFVKETVVPTGANRVVFILAPAITFILMLIGWAVIPFGDGWVLANINVGVLYLFATSSLGVYGIIMAGWSSNSRYAFLGALRSAAQMVSYEVSIGFVIISILLCVGSLNLSAIVHAQQHIWFVIPHLPLFVIFFVSGLAELNRTPFDLVEAESELVSGYNVEYSAMTFALFFLGEYGNMILIGAIMTTLFLGGWMAPFDWHPFTGFLDHLWGLVWFAVKDAAIVFGIVWMRATFPRYRYDQLMRLGWKVFLPFSLGWLVLTACVLEVTGWLPK